MRIKTTLFSVATLFLLFSMLLYSCSGSLNNDDDCQKLLETIPEEVTFITVADLKSLNNKIGEESTYGQIVLKGDLNKDLKTLFIDADSGVKQSVIVLYAVGKSIAITGFLENEDIFKSIIEEQRNEQWILLDEFQECGNTIIRGNQFWIVENKEDFYDSMICFNERKTAFSNEVVADLLPLDKDVKYFINYNKVLSMMLKDMPLETSMAIGVMKDMLIKDLAYAVGGINFEKDVVSFDYNCLTTKGKKAKLTLPLSTIDSKILNRLPSNSDMVVALGLTEELWQTLNAAFEPFAISSMQPFELQIYKKSMEIVTNINKGIALGLKTREYKETGEFKEEEATLLLQTENETSAENILIGVRTLFPTIEDDKNIKINSSDDVVEFTVGVSDEEKGMPQITELFDGKYMGLYIKGNLLNKELKTDLFEHIEITCEDLSSATGRLYLNISDRGNALSALIEMLENQ